jgi:hypothetical protein
MTLTQRLGYLTVSTLLLAGCSTEDSCDVETVVVSLPATIDFEAQQSAVQFEGQVAHGNIGDPFITVREFLIGSGTGGAIWTTDARDAAAAVDFAAFQLSGPLAVGDVVPVTTVLQEVGWGEPASPAPSFTVGVQGFTVGTVSGTFEVLGIGPLRLRIDVVASDGSRDLRFQGEMTARREGDPGCI